MRIDFGIASYQNPDRLDMALQCLRDMSTSDWRCLVVDNNSPDPAVRAVIRKHQMAESRIIPLFLDENLGYVGAVNTILEWAETPNVAYIDNDAYIQTPGWDMKMAEMHEANSELAMIFPNGGTYPIQRPRYLEVLWGVGFCWMMKRGRFGEIGGFDTEIGHQEEVDYQTRLRLAGWRMAAIPEIAVRHDSFSSRNPAAQERINQGVVNWVNKWNKYFTGQTNYHSPNVLRYEDWPTNAIYIEEYLQSRGELAGLNDNPETIFSPALGREVDLIRVPRWQHMYRGRII
jgi:GT2 family glycosyltransferase